MEWRCPILEDAKRGNGLRRRWGHAILSMGSLDVSSRAPLPLTPLRTPLTHVVEHGHPVREALSRYLLTLTFKLPL